jgi:spore photoproduct lyase
VGFHFDPIIYYRGWDKDYRRLVQRVFDRIEPEGIAWISLGSLRFSRDLKKIIEDRFPQNRILDEELVLGFDRKLRYPEALRVIIYRNMLEWIRKRSQTVPVYLCMESKPLWQAVFA